MQVDFKLDHTLGESNNRQFIPNVFKPNIIWKKFPGTIQSLVHKKA